MTAISDNQMTTHRFPADLVRRLVNNYRNKTLDHAPGAMSEPASVFTDVDRFQKERDILFNRGAHIIAGPGNLPNPARS